MNIYGYKGNHKLGEEPLGSENRMLWHDFRTIKGAHKRATRIFGEGNYTLYTYSNFYDNSTFTKV